MNFAIYARVSSAEQVKGYSIASQLEGCRAYVTDHGGQVVSEYIEAVSGTDDQRPQFQQMIRDALAGKFKTIIVSSFDRFARNMEHAVVYKSLLRKEGIGVVSVMEPLDKSSPLAFIHEGIIDLFSAFYSINLSNKIRKGQSKAIEHGRWPHKAPLGYVNRGGWVDVAESGASIAEAFKHFATGLYTLETWADKAYQLGIVNSVGGKISWNHWSKIFNNRFYVGLLSWNGQEIVGVHQPLVDQATFDQVQAVLRANDNHSVHRVYRPYLLRGLLYSIDTQSIMTGATGKTNKGGWKYYRSRQIPYHSVPADILEGQVEQVLCGVTVNPANLTTLEGKLDGAILLALRVAPHLGAVYHWLKTDEQRQALLNIVVSRYGLKVQGKEIVDVEPLPPFGFQFEMSKVELRGVEPLTS